MLAEVNIWMDILAISIAIGAFGFLVFQIAGNFLSGRFHRKFVLHQWPAHEEEVPKTPKFLHGMHLLLMVVLGFSGIYIRYPFFQGGRDFLRFSHYVAMYGVLGVFVLRVYYAMIHDAEEFKITARDITNAPKVIMYYVFIKGSYPHLTKYNVMQKMTYAIMFPLFLIIQAYTGFALIWPKILLGWAASYTGGLAAAAAWSRSIHFTCAMIFIFLTVVHLCLAFVENYPALLDFFGLKKHEEVKA